MLVRNISLGLVAALHALFVPVVFSVPQEVSLEEIARRYTKRTANGIHLPIVRTESPNGVSRRSAVAATIGLGDFVDVAYSVLVTVGAVTTPLIIDSGSSDVWLMSDACLHGCPSSGIGLYPQASFKYSGVDVELFYGDSSTGTYASGKIGKDTMSLAGVTLQDQYFAAVNMTNTSIASVGSRGILGLGYPINSLVWNNLFVAKYEKSQPISGRDSSEEKTALLNHNVKFGSPFPNLKSLDLRRYTFPDVSSLFPVSTGSHVVTRQTTSSSLLTALESYSTLGPFIPRLVALKALLEPMFTVSLQRDTVDVGGNAGLLSIGELPDGIKSENMTWAPLRLYNFAEGGLPAPPNSPNQVYPITWEVKLDGVFFDGVRLPDSPSISPSIVLSALVDTGNSLIRGPADVVSSIFNKLGNSSGMFPCSEPHTLAFQIGGKMFPVDPRDFANQAFTHSVEQCVANLVSTDAPKLGGYLFAWSLGTPFLKGVVASFYYGNLSYPTQDEPKMGFLSTVPSDAANRMVNAVLSAGNTGADFPAISQAAPTGTAKAVYTIPNGLPLSTNKSNDAFRVWGGRTSSWIFFVAVAIWLS